MGLVLYVAKLPAELADLTGNKQVEDKIFDAWFRKRKDDVDAEFDYPPVQFTVMLDRCEVLFTKDENLSGRYPDGKVKRVAVGKVLHLSPTRQRLWEKKLKTIQETMNKQIVTEHSKLCLNCKPVKAGLS